MVRSYTSWVITFVQHMKSHWDVAMVKLPGKPVRTLNGFSQPKVSVPITIPATSPFPACFGAFDFRPKTQVGSFFSSNVNSWRHVLLLVQLIVAVNTLTGCALIPQQIGAPSGPPPNTEYRFDLHGTVNGYRYEGVGVVPVAPEYTLTVESDVDVDLITIETCHRSWSDQDQPIQVGGWFKPKRGFTFQFRPTDGIENLGTCLLRISAYNAQGNPQAYALIDFITPESTLPAYNKCDGDQGPTHGVSICQSKAGLDEELDFDVPVEVAEATLPQCKPRIPKDGKHWLYVLSKGECVVYFQEVAPPHRIHRHTSVGYEKIQLRSVKP